MDFKTVSIVKGLIALSLGSLLLVGCKTTQQAGLGQDRTYDPNQIEDYQLPILVGDIQTQRSFRQFKARETWFWALLNNDTFLPGENVIVQIISDAPLKQPPEIFALVFFGLAVASSVGGRTIWKGWLSVLLGLLIATIGQDPVGGINRFNFGYRSSPVEIFSNF